MCFLKKYLSTKLSTTKRLLLERTQQNEAIVQAAQMQNEEFELVQASAQSELFSTKQSLLQFQQYLVGNFILIYCRIFLWRRFIVFDCQVSCVETAISCNK